ncbi:MAG: SWIM zinc finger family protein [Nitrosopumilaceae archaeon]|nr:SWIM zinc finger family protein [Nitrosopumilaceae archaeon]
MSESDRAAWHQFTHPSVVRQQCTRGIYGQGSKYYKGNRIASVRLNGSTAEAKTSGAQKYDILLSLDDEAVICTCPYGQYGWFCKHMVAAMLHVHHNLEELLDQEQRRIKAVDRFLATLPAERTLGFLASKLKHDGDMYTEFIEKMGLRDTSVRPDPVRLLERTYQDALAKGRIRGNLDLDEVFNIARDCREDGEHAEATGAYLALASTITKHMDTTEDPDGFYADCTIEAVQHLAESVAREDPDPQRKAECASRVLELCMAADGRLAPHYADALETMCGTAQDMERMEGMINEALRSEIPRHGMAALARVKAHILEETGRREQAVRFLSEAYHIDEGLALMYMRMLHHEDPAHARRGAREAAAALPDSTAVARAALDIFEAGDPDYMNTARRLFLETGEWTYLDMIKGHSPDWRAELRRLRDTMIRPDAGRVVEMYLREGMRDEAMEAVEAADMLDIYHEFRPRLARRYGARYFGAYGRKIREFAASRTGRDHYSKVRDHLTWLRETPGCGEAFGALLEDIRAAHPGRRLLLKIVSDL